jgi:hypothetical protein
MLQGHCMTTQYSPSENWRVSVSGCACCVRWWLAASGARCLLHVICYPAAICQMHHCRLLLVDGGAHCCCSCPSYTRDHRSLRRHAFLVEALRRRSRPPQITVPRRSEGDVLLVVCLTRRRGRLLMPQTLYHISQVSVCPSQTCGFSS